MTLRGFAVGLGLAAFTVVGQGCDYTYDTLQPHELRGLFRMFKKIKNDPTLANAIAREITPPGGWVFTRMTVGVCPVNQIDDAWTTAWDCHVEVIGKFKLAGKRYDELARVDGGSVENEVGANGDTLKYVEEVTFSWNPAVRRLTVHVGYPSLPSTFANRLDMFGTYSVHGRSRSTVTTESVNADASFNIFGGSDAFDLGGSVAKTSAQRTSLIRAVISGLGYTASQGFSALDQSVSGQTDLKLGMSWVPNDNRVEFDEQVNQYNAGCLNNRAANASLNVNLQKLTGGVKAAFKSTTECDLRTESLGAHVRYYAHNTLVCGSQGCTGIGQSFNNVFRVYKSGTLCKTDYFVAFNSLVNWELDVETSSGSSAGGIEVGERHQVLGQKSAPYSTPWEGC